MASSSSAARLDLQAHSQVWNPQQVTTPPQYLGRKTLPIKRGDAEALTREDLQYDLLYFIFADPNRVFIDSMAPGKPLVNFCDLYVNALFNSTKCSKVLKDKMVETPEFAIEFAKIALLTNVGRINTTMAFFPEMKTALRSYHPVPSLQKTDGNLQDAPRIKNCLKAALLPSEFKISPPSTPAEIFLKSSAGSIPPTSVVNLIFVLSSAAHSMYLAQTHFDPPIEFLDLFLPINLSSASRARAFLWLMYHYLSAHGTPNPFDDEYSKANLGKVPRMLNLNRDEMLRENQDPPEEIEWGRKMSALRGVFLQELVNEMSQEEKRRKNPPPVPPPVAPPPSITLSAQDLAAIRRPKANRNPPSTSEGSRGSSHGHDYPLAPQSVPRQPARLPQARAETTVDGTERSMLEHAWHMINTIDPLEDSDNEADDHVRTDYERRLRVLSRLRGKAPTPPPENPFPEPQYQPQAPFQQPPPPDAGDKPAQAGSSKAPTGKLRQVAW
ncbi:hypothetical protein EUX98_g2184 [Antrodiella citrinella]|uniref:Ino eighty subunit 1 n=1 Tax=Antrodiella citrinella TaxID=2447956 RepID=A0A4S4N154_9APHY|nr:hypothetical protein EUX98_g2184 [Antrodiella citrinella]